MQLLFLCVFLMAVLLGGLPQGEPLVYVKHLEPPLQYPPLARAARLQGVVILKLTIAGDGTVLDVKATAEDPLRAHQLLQTKTEELIRKWTFGCLNCPPAATYDHVLKFVYKLEGDEKSYDDTRVVMDLPDEVTVTASPPQCDHCAPPVRPKKKSRNLP